MSVYVWLFELMGRYDSCHLPLISPLRIEGPPHVVLRIPRAEVVPAAHAAWVLRGGLVPLAVLLLLEIDVFCKSLLCSSWSLTSLCN